MKNDIRVSATAQLLAEGVPHKQAVFYAFGLAKIVDELNANGPALFELAFGLLLARVKSMIEIYSMPYALPAVWPDDLEVGIVGSQDWKDLVDDISNRQDQHQNQMHAEIMEDKNGSTKDIN